MSRLNITSGTRTYRIPSPTRPLISRTAFQPSPPRESTPEPPLAEISSLDNDPTNQKGFYISFDNEQPKRPKPPLRTKRNSPKKERSYGDMAEEGIFASQESLVNNVFIFEIEVMVLILWILFIGETRAKKAA